MRDIALRYARYGIAIGLFFGLMGFDCGGGKDCPYNGATYHSGDNFPASDGCNSCSCDDGQVTCTTRPCPVGKWFATCGDPVCHGHTVNPNVPPCTTQVLGQPCASLGTECDPDNQCNSYYICATTDPTKGVGGCPISRARYKRDIAYLDDAELERYQRELLDLRLATWRYRSAGPDAPRQLGFIIDDAPDSMAVNPGGETVNLYGYTSLAVATLQAQARKIENLEKELGALRKELAHRPR
jgi:hypothetical protein